MTKKIPAKSVDYVSLRMVKEATVMYEPHFIRSPDDAISIFRQFLDDQDREHFVGLYLNAKNEPVAIHTISIGSLNASVVHPRECFKTAYLANAISVIFCHNHPSGSLDESPEDRDVAIRLYEAGKILGIDVLDFCIVTNTAFQSFKEKGILGD